MSRKLRRRYGRAAAAAGHIECALNKDARKGWVVSLKDASSGNGVLMVDADRGRAIAKGQVEAKKRGIPFVMGV